MQIADIWIILKNEKSLVVTDTYKYERKPKTLIVFS